ncbi:hypothetical protein NP493_934g00004 [Ridgeia piscesae]|uniref:HMG box domain-containing protein n=1 Tax=Ridgeia piscesae TaxID=27915 RepID=A0AAD9KJV9_RIDPI|nr:hypothetical protein NP493_934g00004 [Ridgeia piscesae]
MYNNEHFSQPPPAHMGIPPVNIDPKTVSESPLSIIYSSAFSSHKGYDAADIAGNLALHKCAGLPRPSMYGLPPTSQLSHPFCSDFPQFTWGPPPGYPLAAFRSPYGPPLSSSPLPRFSPPGIMPPHPGFPNLQHPAIITPGPKQEIHPVTSADNNRHHPSQFQLLGEGGGSLHGGCMTPPHMEKEEKKCKKPHIKKPLNAFMLFMKEMRAKVIEECTLKESAAINQILGRKWHALDRAEQAKYYDMARKEKELHMQLYPGWSARDNYALHSKKKKRKREQHTPDNREGSDCSVSYTPPGAATAVDNVHWRGMENCSTEQKYKHDDICAQDCANAKKCRARFGLDQQNQWCKPCRRKKKCIRFLEDGGIVSNPEDDDDDDDDDDGNATSIATVDSTTEGESEIGSPMLPPSAMMFHMDENRNVQHSMVSQSHSPQPLGAPLHMRPHVKHSVENIVELRPPTSSQHHAVSLGGSREHAAPSSGAPTANRTESVASSVSSTMVLAT